MNPALEYDIALGRALEGDGNLGDLVPEPCKQLLEYHQQLPEHLLPAWILKQWIQKAQRTSRGESALWHVRRWCNRNVSWPIPCSGSVRALQGWAKNRPLLSPMQGRGMLESLLRHPQLHASDLHAKGPASGPDAADAVKRHNHPRALLLLSWPPYSTDAAIRALRAFSGPLLAYWGEGPEGCCADDAFFAELAQNWQLAKEPRTASWPGIRDRLQLWRRRS